MIYTITFMKGDQSVGSKSWDKGLEAAKKHARDHLPIHQTQSGATHVEVRNEKGVLCYHHPRVMGAPGG